jgi:hypothetical protein
MSFCDFDEYERLVAAASSVDATAHLIVLLGWEAGERIARCLPPAREKGAAASTQGVMPRLPLINSFSRLRGIFSRLPTHD